MNTVPSSPVPLGWFSHHVPVWEEVLAPLKDQPDVRFLEIGSWTGSSACWLLQNVLTHPTARLTCIDPFVRDREFERETVQRKLSAPVPDDLDLEKEFDRNIRTVGGEARIIKLKGRSQEVLRTMPLRTFDGIYIDGSHLATDVLTDAVLCFDLLKAGGILIFDDDRYRLYASGRQNPSAAIGAFCAIFADHIEVLHAGWQVILRKKPMKNSPTLAHGKSDPSTVSFTCPSPRLFRFRQWLLKIVLGL